MTHPTRTPDPIAELMREASVLDEQNAEAARSAFLERINAELTDRHHSRKSYWLAPLALAAAVALAWLVWSAPSISYNVAGASEDGGYVRANSTGPATVWFSDETKVTATASSRLRVVETDANGARLSLEQGQLSVQVVHRGDTSWDFIAGPFHVHVTGTRFDLTWDPETERIQVDLHEGSVEIAGFDDSGPVPLRAGQRFVGDARNRTMEVSHPSVAARADRKDSTAEPPLEDPSMAVAGSEAPQADHPIPTNKKATKIPGEPQKPAAAAMGWSTLVSKGRFEDVVVSAEKRGIGQCLASCNPSDLGALADAARYTGRSSLAEESLAALRSRFPGATGTRAAFLLGRLHEGRGQMTQARTWYETSLQESPSGTYASESLAGKMRVVLSLQGREAAKPIAQDYLKRYPQGVHSSAARKVLQP